MFRAAALATGTQIVRFSKGANEMIERDGGFSGKADQDTRVRTNPVFDPELHGHPNHE